MCVKGERVLLVHHVTLTGETHWTLPGGEIEHAEDPFDAVVREVAEETGYQAVVERLLGVDSRMIPAAHARLGVEQQAVGVFYGVRVVGGVRRSETNGGVVESVWTPLSEVAHLRRSAVVDVGLTLARTAPPTGHVAPVPVGGLIRH
ncbi:NUDIX domain-containing protein [Micromonospora sp. WMMD1120]|nr:NUDIX domain-containing protein [Micromonospora sp. WMMD1120]MDG4809284.1 NUDIX domain-containing protein [Micromonospora sp. WMMD1120]